MVQSLNMRASAKIKSCIWLCYPREIKIIIIIIIIVIIIIIIMTNNISKMKRKVNQVLILRENTKIPQNCSKGMWMGKKTCSISTQYEFEVQLSFKQE